MENDVQGISRPPGGGIVEAPVIRVAGDQAVLIEFESRVDVSISARIHALAQWIAEHVPEGIYECVPGYCTLLVEYDPFVLPYARITNLIETALTHTTDVHLGPSRLLRIPVCYGGVFGPDLEYVARYNNLSSDEVVAIHTEYRYFVHFTGFLPGFPFLGGLSPRIATPRLPTPRPVVPAGSVGIAGEQTGFYPIESPGGWRLIGRIPIQMYDPRRDDPFLVHQGDWIQFYAISEQEYQEFRAADAESPCPIWSEPVPAADQQGV